MRRHAKMWAVGMQPRKHQHTGAQGFIVLEGSSASNAKDEELVHPAGCSTTARIKEDGPVIWEALPLLHGTQPVQREPVTNPYGGAYVRARATRPRTSPDGEGRPERGEPERGRDGEQGVGGPKMSYDAGERLAPGPGRAKQARADVSLWGET